MEPTGPARSGRPDDRRHEIRGGIDASWQSRITLRSIRATGNFLTTWPTGLSFGFARARAAIAKLFGLHAMLPLALPAENRPMRREVGAVATPFVLDLVEDR
jgi:hypothetical protein